ncbi:MAG: primosomal protein N' [Salinivirgaceae bacterium]|nr:primosomal protein N' [Salinivirgaceae bacterium]
MNREPLFVDVILPVPVKGFFTYELPAGLSLPVPGMRVVVPFGKKKLYTGIVFSVHAKKPEGYETKPLLQVLDEFPVVNKWQMRLWEWASDYYMCPVGEIYKAAIPSGLRLESETNVYPTFSETAPATEDERVLQIWRFLQKQELSSITEISNALGISNILPLLKKMLDKGWIQIQEDLKQYYRPKQSKFIGLAPRIDTLEKIEKIRELLAKAPKQQELFNYFLSQLKTDQLSGKTFLKSQLLDESGTGAATLKTLLDKNILKETEVEVSRLADSNEATSGSNTLNQHQQKALGQIGEQFLSKEVVLLHGVTSSGKTEIYIHLIDKVLKQNKQVLYLLPEIALTSQIVQRLRNVFGNSVGVYHSKFSDAERVEIYQRIQENHKKPYQIILGVRSSVFLPFSNLGLIIVDEEHENTYKQFDPAPRYNARDLSVVLAGLHQAKVLLGTATPSIESYFNAQSGRYGLVELMQRHQEIQLPKIILADVRKAYKKKEMHSHFTATLLANVEEALEKKEQVILFQNRRGFSPYMECASCGWIPTCKFCNVSLTYHKNINKLTCHYCGYSIDGVYRCGHCNRPHLETKGFGTEKVEDEISLIYPDARVARLDLDTTRGKYGHETIINDFQNQHIDILIGTQMVSKGLDFDHVSVVGILNADNMLRFPDFRAYERSYQLMAQVSGRAGRKNKQGKVVIQTNDTGHAIIQQVMQNNYKLMYQQQLDERQRFFYPPFSRLIKLTLKHRDNVLVNQASLELVKQMQQIGNLKILGPTIPPINRIQNLFIRTALIKLGRGNQLTKAKHRITETIDGLKNRPSFKGVQYMVDVDPM